MGPLSLSDAVSKIPGMSQLSTGNGISSRSSGACMVTGYKQYCSAFASDNQQWPGEHGLGLTDVGVDRIEVIKGPATLEYGSRSLWGAC
jgi:iron complex outermembrane receptor protein